jgi:hypothetical protein
MDGEELAREYEAAMEALLAAEHGTDKPKEGAVTCLATDRSSDLCRITEGFDRLGEHGYIAEPALWVTTSGCWQMVYDQAEDEHPSRLSSGTPKLMTTASIHEATWSANFTCTGRVIRT